LSSTQELDLCQKIYNKVWNNRPWVFAQTPATGNTSTSVPYIALPEDFSYVISNNQETGSSAPYTNDIAPKVIFLVKSSNNYSPVQLINWNDRRKYVDQDGYAYINLVNSQIVFTKQPDTVYPYEFDYVKTPDTLTTNSTPAFPTQFHDMLYHGMAVDDDIILRFPKAQSYAPDNQAKYDSYLTDMAWWNSQFYMN